MSQDNDDARSAQPQPGSRDADLRDDDRGHLENLIHRIDDALDDAWDACESENAPLWKEVQIAKNALTEIEARLLKQPDIPGTEPRPTIAQSAAPLGSCLICGHQKPFVVFSGLVGVCLECQRAAVQVARLTEDTPQIFCAWDGGRGYVISTRTAYEKDMAGNKISRAGSVPADFSLLGEIVGIERKQQVADQLEIAYQRVPYGMPIEIPETLMWDILGYLRSYP